MSSIALTAAKVVCHVKLRTNLLPASARMPGILQDVKALACFRLGRREDAARHCRISRDLMVLEERKLPSR